MLPVSVWYGTSSPSKQGRDPPVDVGLEGGVVGAQAVEHDRELDRQVEDVVVAGPQVEDGDLPGLVPEVVLLAVAGPVLHDPVGVGQHVVDRPVGDEPLVASSARHCFRKISVSVSAVALWSRGKPRATTSRATSGSSG